MSKSKERAEKNARKLRHSFADKPQPKTTQSPVEGLIPSPEPLLQTPQDTLIDIRASRIEQEEERKNLLDALKKLAPENPEFNKVWGELLFGTEMKIEDGKKVPWTSEDFYQHSREEVDKEERSSRKSLTRDLTFGFDMQSRHFGNPENPEHGKTTEIIDACATILGKVLSSDEQVTEMWPISRPEERTQAQLLEVIRRITLRPSYFMFGLGHDRELDAFSFPGDDFEERFKAFRRYDNFLAKTGFKREGRAEREFIETNVAEYTDEDWNRILAIQEHLVFKYVRDFAGKFASGSQRVSQVAPRLVEYGEAVYTQEELDLFRKKAKRADQMAAGVLEMHSFDDLYPQIKKWFGKEAGFKEFLEKFDPIRVTRRGTFELPSSDFFD